MADKSAAHPGWDRRGLHLRLSKERLASLRAIASDLPAGCSPSEAVDNAIEIATAACAAATESGEARFDDIDDAIERLSRQSAAEATRQQEVASGIARHVKELRDLISAVAGPAPEGGDDIENGNHRGDADQAMPTLRDWLDSEAAESPRASLLAKAQWRSKRRADDQSMTVELLVEALAAMPDTGRPRGPARLAKLRLAKGEKFIDDADRMGDFYLACQRDSDSWSLVARHIDSDGGIGQTFGSSTT